MNMFKNFLKSGGGVQPKLKTVNDEEQMILDTIVALMKNEKTLVVLLDGVGYVSNEEIGYDAIINSDYITITIKDGFRSAKIREDFSKMLVVEILNCLRGKISKIKEASKSNEASLLKKVLDKIRN